MASNISSLKDEDGTYQDWLELFNAGTNVVNLYGWYLTDTAATLANWQFPQTNIAAGGYVLVFASAKNRAVSGRQLHTNFKLTKNAGGYLALVHPDGVTIEHAYTNYPAQADNISYGYSQMGSGYAPLLGPSSLCKWRVPTNSTEYSSTNFPNLGGWTSNAYNDVSASWAPAQLGVGFDRLGTFGDLIGPGGDCEVKAYTNNASVCVRIPFVVANTAQVSVLRLANKYDDGFVAWLNGRKIASDLAPANPAYNSTATGDRSDALTTQLTYFTLTNKAPGYLINGTNILAIQGLNAQRTNSNLLVLPQLEALFTGGTTATNGSYLVAPTPLAANAIGRPTMGPLITDTTVSPPRPLGTALSPPISITTTVAKTLANVGTVTLAWRQMFSNENFVTMSQIGTSGVYTQQIPTAALGPGQMIRWRIIATDVNNTTNNDPPFLEPLNADQYYGTIAMETSYTSSLPVWYWFTTNTTAATNVGGTRCCVFWNDQFCDNVFVGARGGASSIGSQKFNFNAGNHLKMGQGIGAINVADLNTSVIDASAIRPTLSFEMYRDAGEVASSSFHLQMRLNGNTDRVLYYAEVFDDNYLQHHNLDPDGALYQMDKRADAAPLFTDATDGVAKKTRLYEGNTDLVALCSAIFTTNDATFRRNWMLDNFEIPHLINFLTVRCMIQDADDVSKNQYIYRDSNGNCLWRSLPWDKDATCGVLLYGLPNIYHPFYGDSAHPRTNQSPYSILWDLAFNDPMFRAMYLRHLRTQSEKYFMPAGSSWMDIHAQQWMAEVQNNVGPAVTNNFQSVRDFINQRRVDLFDNYSVTSSVPTNALIPLAQPPDATVVIGAVDSYPVSGNQAEEYIRIDNTNSYDVDISNWKVSGAVSHTFDPGTVIISNSSLYLAANEVAFRARATSPHGGQGLFIQGNFNGQLSSRGETINIVDSTNRLVTSLTYTGTPSDVQSYFRVTEIMYNAPAQPGSTNLAVEFEYVEVKNVSTNVTLNLGGVVFTNAFDFKFGTNAALAPGAYGLIVKNPGAMAERYGGGLPILGTYTGNLNNAGENILINDAAGEKVLDFIYNNSWYPLTDGLGFSLVIRDENADWHAWDTKANWRSSGALSGDPGVADPGIPNIAPVLINEALTHTDPPNLDTIELYNPTASSVNIGGWFLTDDFYSPKKYRIPSNTFISAHGYVIFDETQFDPNPGVFPSFKFNSAGDDLWLFSADGSSNLTGYVQGWVFGAAQNPISFGRFVNRAGQEYFVQQSTNTLGYTNAYPRVWPVVISEIMYHPPNLGTNANTRDEFVEVANVAAIITPLYDPNFPTNTFHLRGGISFDFPTNIVLPVGGRIIAVGFDPANATNLAAFRAAYSNSIPTNVPIVGPWSGALNNGGDTVTLRRPDPPNSNAVPYILIEDVDYQPAGLWPSQADGWGASLQRIELNAFGNDPYNWYPGAPTPGAPENLTLDSDGDGAPDWAEYRAGTDPLSATNVLRMLSVDTNVAGRLIHWQSVTGRTYSVEASTNLFGSGRFTVLQAGVVGATPETQWVDPAATNAQRFYRVRVEP